MPTTINGIGTHYYGRSNSEKHSGTCHSCGRSVTLESYDTRLWFVIVFIPLIPLGRKRIIDQCPVCKRHFAADADQWETQKQLNVSGALERYQSDPTAEHAMEAHQQLLNFHQMAEAAHLRQKIAEEFRQNAKVQAYLGYSLAGIGLPNDGLVYYQRAFELRPDLPEARVGLAYDHMRHGRLNEARALLDFLEKPGAAQLYSLEPIETLGNAYAQIGKQSEALEMYRVIVEGLPQVAEVPAFRTKVKRCEKALHHKQSILPKLKFSWKRFFGRGPGNRRVRQAPLLTWRGLAGVGAVIVLIAGGFLVRNEYVRRHRPLYIVNGFKQPATVEVQGVGTVQVGTTAQEMDLKEGRYHATVSGPVKQEIDFEVGTSYGDRWSTGNSVWVLNVGSEALLLEVQATYRASSPPPPTVQAHFGKPIERIDGLTHPFQNLPETVQMKSTETRVLKELNFFRHEPAQLIGHFQRSGRRQEALQLAEWRLKGHPEDEDALSSYLALAEPKQVEDFLRAGLSRRPVQLAWHRAYQNLRRTSAWYAWLTVEYDNLLSADPQSASLTYLRGRLESNVSEAERWFGKARDLDPQNPYPYYGLAYHCVARGDWEGARPLFSRSVELRPDRQEFFSGLFSCRLALKEYSAMETECRAKLTKEPRDIATAMQLVDVLAAQDRNTEASGVIGAFGKSLAGVEPQTAGFLSSMLRRRYFYSVGDFDGLAKEVKDDRSPEGRDVLFSALIEQRKVAEAVRIHPLEEPKITDPYHFLVVSIAWALANDRTQADEWLKKSVQLFAAGSAEDIQAAALLTGKNQPTAEILKGLSGSPKSKAILLTALGMLHADQRQELYSAARVLNVERSYPFQLVHRITESR